MFRSLKSLRTRGIEMLITEMFHDILPELKGPVNADLFTAGGDSLQAVDIQLRLQREFDLRIELELFRLMRPAELATYISEQKKFRWWQGGRYSARAINPK